jgi:gliding motility-associated lipoprotein GldH
MRIISGCFVLAVLFSACDQTRVYEKNNDLQDRIWLANDTSTFRFQIPDTVSRYNLYCNIRNSVSFPYARLFVNYYLTDSSGKLIQKKLVQTFLFDRDTGKPFGSSALGDIYDHRLTLVSAYKFPYAGKFNLRFEQFMRTDSLQGILAVGLRVEKAQPPQ